MLCQNCGKNEVTFRYTQVINGVKKEMALCDKCAKSLGLEGLDFNMSIDFSNFLGDFFNLAADTDLLPNFTKTGVLQCDNCKMTYNEFVDNGKFGCSHCYDVFESFLSPVFKNIHGSNMHVGRRSRLPAKDKRKVAEDIAKASNKSNSSNEEKLEQNNEKQNTKEGNNKIQSNKKQEIKLQNAEESKELKIKMLNSDLKLAIKEERYEDAAKLRDEIKKLEE